MENMDTNTRRDRQLVAAGEGWEMEYITKKFRVSETMVKRAINAVGNSRVNVENYIRRQQMKPALHAHA
jgi:Mor family transcriptional regulator